MEVVGADVEALYPSLSDVQVAEIVYKAVTETEVGFEGVNYLEGANYITLNSTAVLRNAGYRHSVGYYHPEDPRMGSGQESKERIQWVHILVTRHSGHFHPTSG